MRKAFGLRWATVVAGAAMLLVLAAACGTTEVIKEVQVPGETIVVEKEVQVPGETIVVEKEVVKEVIKTVAGPERIVLKEVPAGQEDRWVRNVWGEVVEKPQYGGTIPIAISVMPDQFDTFFGGSNDYWTPYVLDELGSPDWALPGDEYNITSGYYDMSFMTGELAESWEISSDLTTYVFNIRKGIQWHDKAPMNGREFTASDVEFTFNRTLGLGEFAADGPSVQIWGFTNIPAESTKATGKYTFEVKIHTPGMDNLGTMLGILTPSDIQAPEVIREHGDTRDWKVVVGTGPYEITDFVLDSSLTFTRNPNYWKFDSRYPDLNLRLPYADTIELFSIPELAARVAALRTGKTAAQGGQHLSPDQVESLQHSNPELVSVPLIGTSKTDASFAMWHPIFKDLNVRIAMQKAINLNEINTFYYGGKADPTPLGFAPLVATGYYVPYSQWPEDVKYIYEFDPAEAERLLDEAGYPRGGDGVRFTAGWDFYPPWGSDPDLGQLVTGYWDAIGVDVSINNVADGAELSRRNSERIHGGLTHCGCRHKNANPLASLPGRFYGDKGLARGITDPVFNTIIENAWQATDKETQLKFARDADMHFVKNMWSLMLPVVPQTMLISPWLKDYRGEQGGGDEAWAGVFMWTWVDQELKSKMGQ